jgi:glycine cleavage system H protein
MADTDPACPGIQAGPAGTAGPAARLALVEVHGFPLALDRLFDPGTHMWVVLMADPALARMGMDPLGVETSGTLAELSFAPTGARLVRGEPFGQLEAAKFVGPLVSPLSGTVLAANEAVAADPGLAERDPFGEGWLIDIAPDNLAGELPALLSDPDQIIRWFAAKVEDYRVKGVIAQ